MNNRSNSSMSHHEPRPEIERASRAVPIVPALTLAEYRARTANATRPIGDPPIGARRRPGSSPTWGDLA